MKKYLAFTLAEVMITMALLGAIATMTLQNIGNNIQRSTRLAEFKTGYSMLDVSLKNVMSEKLSSSSCYACPSDNYKQKYGLSVGNTCSAKTSCASLENALMKELGVAKKCVNASDNSCISPFYKTGESCFTDFSTGNSYVLENGMIVITDGNKSLTQFALDVNGKRGPNKWGEDVFTFAVTASQSQVVGEKTYVSALSVLPPEGCLLGHGNSDRFRSSEQMLEAISNKR